MTGLLERARDGLAALLQNSAKGKAIADGLAADHEGRRLARRSELATELEALKTANRGDQRAYEEEDAPDIDAEAAAVAQLRDIRQRRGVRLLRRQERALAQNQRRDRLMNELRDSASPILTDCLAALDAAQVATVELRDHVYERGFDGRRILAWSNDESVNARLAAIRAAMQEVREMYHLRAVTDEELTAQFRDLCASFPGVETRPAQYWGAGDGDAAA